MLVSAHADTISQQGMQFAITTEIDAPPEVVVAVLSEVEWMPTVTPVERLGDASAPLALGDRV